MFAQSDKDNFSLSSITVGEGIAIIKPVLEGEWAGIKIFTSPEPCLRIDTDWTPFLPAPFPETVCCAVY